MAKFLVVYGTTEGQSGKIATMIAEWLAERNHEVVLRDAKDASTIDPRGFDGVVVGASVHAGGYQRAMRHWVRRNAPQLSARPGAFFSVCLGILQRDDLKVQHEVQRFATDLFEWSGWHPAQWAIFAGALSYSKYGWIKRNVMQSISRRAGGATDVSRDYEYTDWSEVRKFTLEFARAFETSGPVRALEL